MLSPLKPLLCRHEFYWSERHQSDRCHRCGKTRAATEPLHEAGAADPDTETALHTPETSVYLDAREMLAPTDGAFDIPLPEATSPAAMTPIRRTPSAKVLRAQAQERRENLLALLDRIADGGQPSRRDSLDAILGVIEDAHSADPVLFGEDAAGHFARLHDARSGLIF